MSTSAARRIAVLAAHIHPDSPTSPVGGYTVPEGTSTLEAERAASRLTPAQRDALTEWIMGGPQAVKDWETAARIIRRDPLITTPDPFDMSRPEARRTVMRKIRRFAEYDTVLGRDAGLFAAFYRLVNMQDASVGMKIYVHRLLFRDSINILGTDEQWAEWQPLIDDMRVLGCFAMTELGHSSFLRGLETTATYDASTQEFVIDSPTDTASKWWIGMAGQSATHTVALCNLTVGGKPCGLHWFIVPLRSRSTGETLPGVAAGDIGPKLGRNGLDNGWIQFTQVRVPRENMLRRWASVSPSGEFTANAKNAMAYNVLIKERIYAIENLHWMTSMAATVAVRYSAIRRQGPNDEQIIDYQSQQLRLMPALAGTLAWRATGRFMQSYNDSLLAIQKDKPNEYFKHLSGLHCSSAGLKAYGTWWSQDTLEVVRRSLGGHGYSSFSGIPGFLGDHGVATTGAGDNIVMAQQAAKVLLKTVQSGKPAVGTLAYLSVAARAAEEKKTTVRRPDDLLDTETQIAIYHWVVINRVKAAGGAVAKAIASGKSAGDAWNENMMELVACARSHAYCVAVKSFADVLGDAAESVQPVLKSMCDLFALHSLEEELVFLLERGYFDISHSSMVRQLVIDLSASLRRDAVVIVDAFAIPDHIHKSPLGRADGDIYTHYLGDVKAARGCQGVPDFWEESIKPLVHPDQGVRSTL